MLNHWLGFGYFLGVALEVAIGYGMLSVVFDMRKKQIEKSGLPEHRKLVRLVKPPRSGRQG